jgi:hypothetical protein
MRSNDRALVVAGLGALLAAALVSGVRYGARPMPARMEAAAPVPADASGPARPSASRLCFHGPEGDLLDLPPAGQPCP